MYEPVRYRCTSADFPEDKEPTIPSLRSGTLRLKVHSWLFTNESGTETDGASQYKSTYNSQHNRRYNTQYNSQHNRKYEYNAQYNSLYNIQYDPE